MLCQCQQCKEDLFFAAELGVAAEVFGAEAGDGAMGESAFELAGCHLVDAVASERFHRLGEGKIFDGRSGGIDVVRAAKLALITSDDPVADYSRDPFG